LEQSVERAIGYGMSTPHLLGMPATMSGLSAGMVLVICFRHLQVACRSAVLLAAAFRLLTPEQQAAGGSLPRPMA